MKMLHPIIAGLMLGTASMAYAEQINVKAVEVEAEASDATNQTALQYYPEVEQHLMATIAERVGPLTDEDGFTVKVRLDEMSLDGNPMGPDRAFNVLDGWVYIYPPDPAQSDVNDNSAEFAPIDEFNIHLEASTMGAGLQPGTDDYYTAMIAAFADSVGERVSTIDRADIPS